MRKNPFKSPQIFVSIFFLLQIFSFHNSRAFLVSKLSPTKIPSLPSNFPYQIFNSDSLISSSQKSSHPPSFFPLQNSSAFAANPQNQSLHLLSRRASPSSQPAISPGWTIKEPYPMAGIQWLGEGTESTVLFFVLQYLGESNSGSHLWLSQDQGKTFVNHDEAIDGNILQAILRLDSDPKSCILLCKSKDGGQARKQLIYTSADSGRTFIKRDFNGGEIFKIYPHPKDAQKIIAIAGESLMKIFYSTDFGASWHATNHPIDSHVISLEWGLGGHDTGESVYWTSFDSFAMNESSASFPTRVQTLHFTHDLFRTSVEIGTHVVAVKIIDKFVFYVHNDPTDPASRYELYSTFDHNNFHAAKCIFSDAQSYLETGYNIEDSFTGSIFVTVDYTSTDFSTGSSTIRADLYVSDASATVFTLSLRNHFIFKQSDQTGGFVSDFTRIHSIPGTFITNQKVFAREQLFDPHQYVVNTVITFDNGGKWSSLVAPPESLKRLGPDCANCTLHLHSFVSSLQNQIPAVYSVENAVGLVIGIGNVGTFLGTDPFVYLSRDGGKSWREIFEGIYTFVIADHGGLIVGAQVAVQKMASMTDQLQYSFSEGTTWQSVKLPEKVFVSGLSTEPGSKTQVVSLFGYRSDRHWIVFQLDFVNMSIRQCTQNDLEEWVPIDDENHPCLLGTKYFLKRRKLDSECFLGVDYDPLHREETCACNDEDFECDLGYMRSSSGTCIRDMKFTLTKSMICPAKNQKYYHESKGYRKVAGDQCVGGQEDKYLLMGQKYDKKCSDFQGPDIPAPTPDTRPSFSSSALTVALVVTFIAFVLVVVAMYLPYRYNMGIFGAKTIRRLAQKTRTARSGGRRGGGGYSILSQQPETVLMDDEDEDDDQVDPDGEVSTLFGQDPSVNLPLGSSAPPRNPFSTRRFVDDESDDEPIFS